MRLHLLRHAKSSWDDPRLDDHSRPLAPRGVKAGRQLATWIGDHGPHPTLVLCSTATRARETLELVLPALGDPDVSFEDGLYHASAGALLERVRALEGEPDDVMVVGHNPGLQDVALLLSVRSPDRERIATKLPTGALVTLETTTPWALVAPGSARIVELVLPREL